MNKTIFALFLSTVGALAQPTIPATTPWSRAFLRQTSGVTEVNTTSGLTNAIANASSGDTIFLQPGRYTNNNMLKQGLNFYLAPGATIWYQQTTTNDAGWGIIDDRTTGATTNYIMGYGDFYFLRGTNGFGDTGTYNYNGNTHGMLVVTNPLTEIHFQANRVWIAGVAGSGYNCAFNLENFQRAFIDVDEVYDLWYGLTITLKDTTDDTDDYFSNVFGLRWSNGKESYVKIRRMNTMGGTYGVWGDENLTTNPGNHNAASDFYYTGDLMTSKIYISCVSTNFRSWWNLKELLAPDTTSLYGSGKHYFTFGKVQSSALTKATIDVNGNFVGGSNIVVWLTAQKIAGPYQWIGSTGSGNNSFSTVYANVLHYEDVGGVNTGILVSANSEFHINGGYMNLTGVGVRHDGGLTFLDGVTIDNSLNGTRAPIEIASSGLTIKNVRLIAPSTTNSISGPSAQTVKVWSSSTSNRPIGTNTTLNPSIGFFVDTALGATTNVTIAGGNLFITNGLIMKVQ